MYSFNDGIRSFLMKCNVFFAPSPNNSSPKACFAFHGDRSSFQFLTSNDTRAKLQFKIPARGLIGFRNEFIRMTKGEGILCHTFLKYDDYAGDIQKQRMGSLISFI